MTNIENDQNIIIEGCYLPKTIEELDNEYLCKIIYLYIIFSENYIRKNILEKIQKNKSIIEKRGNDFDELGYMNVEKYVSENKYNKENCIKNGVKYIEINEDYGKEMEKIYKWIGDEIKKLYNGVRLPIANQKPSFTAGTLCEMPANVVLKNV